MSQSDNSHCNIKLKIFLPKNDPTNLNVRNGFQKYHFDAHTLIICKDTTQTNEDKEFELRTKYYCAGNEDIE